MKPNAIATSIPEAVNRSYAEAIRYCDGYLVINRSRLIVWIDLGAQRILKIDREDAINSSLIPFLPPEIRSMHDTWVDREFALIDEAIASDNEYTGRYMGVAPTATKVKYIRALDGMGEEISIGIEFVPIVWLQDEVQQIGLIAFISLDPAQRIEERIVKQTSEATEVIRIARADTAILYAEKAGTIFTKMYAWIKTNALSSWINFLAFVFTSTIVLFILVMASYATWFFFFRKGPQTNEFNITAPSSSPEHVPSSPRPGER